MKLATSSLMPRKNSLKKQPEGTTKAARRCSGGDDEVMKTRDRILQDHLPGLALSQAVSGRREYGVNCRCQGRCGWCTKVDMESAAGLLDNYDVVGRRLRSKPGRRTAGSTAAIETESSGSGGLGRGRPGVVEGANGIADSCGRVAVRGLCGT